MSDICAELEIDILKAGIEQLEGDKRRLLQDKAMLKACLYKIAHLNEMFGDFVDLGEVKKYAMERLEHIDELERSKLSGEASASDSSVG